MLSQVMNLIAALHPAVVHFPIALLLVASILGLVVLLRSVQPFLPTVTWWSMLGGWIGTILAILTGLIAQGGLPPQAPYRGLLNWHTGLGLSQLVIYGYLLYRGWLHAGRRGRGRRAASQTADLLFEPGARIWVFILLLAGALTVVASGWSGGRLVFEWGVGVDLPSS